MRVELPITIAFLFFAVSISCSEPAGDDPEKGVASKPLVLVSNYPLQYFVERIASQQRVEIQFPAGRSGDPAYWQPDPEEIASAQTADLILLNGASYEQWLDSVTLPSAKLINTSSAFTDSLIASEATVTHSHGPGGEHEHQGTAFTTWLDLSLAVAQAEAVCDALSGLMPEHEELFGENFSRLKAELTEMDSDLAAIVASAEEPRVIFSHPVYQYLERRYGLKGTSLHWEPDAIPDAAMWKEFRHILEHGPVRGMIWEGKPPSEVVEKLKELGVESVVFSPCGNLPESGDFVSVMRQNIDSLKQLLS